MPTWTLRPTSTASRKIASEAAHALFIHFQADQQPSPRPSISRGAVQNSPGMQRPVQPPAEKNADQHGDDDDPAQHADLGQASRDRGIALAQPAPVPLHAPPHVLHERIRLVRLCHAEPSRAAPVRPQMAHDLANGVQLQARLLHMLDPLRLGLAAEAARERGRRGLQNRRPPRASRVAMAMFWPPVTVRMPRRTAQ